MSDSDKSEPDKDTRSFAALPKPDASSDAALPPADDKPARRGWFDMPEGALGFFVLLLLAAACGGLIAIYWPWMTGAGADNSAMADRVSALESRVGQLASGQAPKAAAATFSDLQRKVADIKARLDADEARLTAVEKSTGGDNAVDLTALKAGLDKNSSDIAQLGQQLDKFSSAQNGAGGGTPAPQLAARLGADEKAIAALRKELDGRVKATGEALDQLGGRVAELEKRLPPAGLSQRLDALATKSDVAALGTRVGHLEDQDTTGLVRRAASVLALADLVRASEGSQPFATELDALRAVMPDAPEIADLSNYAQSGVPTVPMLGASFDSNIDTILAAERDAQAHNWFERIWADVIGLVSVRRVGNVPGNSTQARLARAEFALKHGDLAGAISDVEGLDQSAQQAAADWLGKGKARLAVNRDARALTNRIVSELAAAQAQKKAAVDTQAGAQP